MGREALPLPWSPLFDGGGVGAEGPPSLQLGEWAGSALVGGGGDVCAAIQSWGDYATFARSGYRGRLTVVTGQAVPPILGMREVMFLVNRRGLLM